MISQQFAPPKQNFKDRIKRMKGLRSVSTSSISENNLLKATEQEQSPVASALLSSSPTKSCGNPNIPDLCNSDIQWALNHGRYEHPEWYKGFEEVTGVALTNAGAKEVVSYWMCTTIPNTHCGGLQFPCGFTAADCGSITTEAPCGYVPDTCESQLLWAIGDGVTNHPEWYPNFATITGRSLTAASKEDMALYWTCTTIPNKEKCAGLEAPCDRECRNITPSPINSDVSDYVGFDLSIGLQSNPLSVSRVAAITAALKGVKNYKFYGHAIYVEIARAIVAASSFPNELRFYIEIDPHFVNNLQTSDIESLLDTWSDLKQYVYWIALGK